MAAPRGEGVEGGPVPPVLLPPAVLGQGVHALDLAPGGVGFFSFLVVFVLILCGKSSGV